MRVTKQLLNDVLYSMTSYSDYRILYNIMNNYLCELEKSVFINESIDSNPSMRQTRSQWNSSQSNMWHFSPKTNIRDANARRYRTSKQYEIYHVASRYFTSWKAFSMFKMKGFQSFSCRVNFESPSIFWIRTFTKNIY